MAVPDQLAPDVVDGLYRQRNHRRAAALERHRGTQPVLEILTAVRGFDIIDGIGIRVEVTRSGRRGHRHRHRGRRSRLPCGDHGSRAAAAFLDDLPVRVLALVQVDVEGHRFTGGQGRAMSVRSSSDRVVHDAHGRQHQRVTVADQAVRQPPQRRGHHIRHLGRSRCPAPVRPVGNAGPRGQRAGPIQQVLEVLARRSLRQRHGSRRRPARSG